MPVSRGIATFGLDYGKCPPWLFRRMTDLGGKMVDVIIDEFGPDEFVRRMGEPGWFQSLGTVLAFDWNASGLTTILTAALKEAIRGREYELGIAICGGKGKTSLKTPEEITKISEKFSFSQNESNSLVYNSKMAAKVDSSLVQDGFQIYHHAFFFSRNGAWTVVQQGMNEKTARARRYHWHSKYVSDIVVEPHSGISSQSFSKTLNMTAKESVPSQKISTELARGNYKSLIKDLEIIDRHSSDLSQALRVKQEENTFSYLNLETVEFKNYPVEKENFSKSRYLQKILKKLSDEKPKNYEELVATRGVGPKTVRALSLVSEVIYGARPSYVDPARYSFAHGGKDATPYPVDRKTYDKTIDFFGYVIKKMKISQAEKNQLMNKLPRV